MDVLLVVPFLPYPVRDGDSLRHYNMIKRLSGECNIYLVAFAGEEQLRVGVNEMKRYCREVRAVKPIKRSRAQWMRLFAGNLLRGVPQCATVHYVPEMRTEILDLLHHHRFDIVQVEHTFMAQYLRDAMRLCLARTILTVHNIEQVKSWRLFKFEPWSQQKIRYLIDSVVLKRFEPWAIRLPDKCITVSAMNATQISSGVNRKDVIVIENGVDVATISPVLTDKVSTELLFLGGMNYTPNVDAAVYMATSILPLIRGKMPDVKLNIVGRNPQGRVTALASIDGVTVCGDAPEVKPWYERSAVSVVPLRSGGGTRLKILESMAFGVPVVSTAVGCEGLDVTNGKDIAIADTPVEFADAVCKVLQDPGFGTKLTANARALVESRYSWDAIAPKLLDVYKSLLEVKQDGTPED